MHKKENVSTFTIIIMKHLWKKDAFGFWNYLVIT